MSIIKRKLKLIIFFLMFMVISPIVILYAKGDIFSDGWSLLETGGIYVMNAPVGSNIYLNSKFKETTGFFSRDVLIKNLRPGTYEIQVKKDGYNTWFKKIKVSSNLVADADVFTLPEKIELREITKYLVDNTASTSSKLVTVQTKNQEYIDVMDLFKATTTKIVAKDVSSSTIDFKNNLGTAKSPVMNNKLGLWKDKTKIFVQWFGRNESAPKYLCDKDFDCMKSKLVFELAHTPTKIDFLPGYDGVLLVASENLVFAVQIEDNPNKMIQILYKGNNPDFKLSGSSIFIKDGTSLYEAVL